MKLSKKQKSMVKQSIGKGTDFPKMTSDPYVNHRADMLVCGCPPWEELSKEEQQQYKEEAMVFQST